MKKTRLQKGFTIVETLVAITILMIAIAGPLTVADKAYRAALDARNVAIANNLAQEGLEEINNLKDNGIGSGGGWLSTWSACISTKPCGVGLTPTITTGSISINFCSAMYNGCNLAISNDNLGYTFNADLFGYSVSSNVTDTPFNRSFYLTKIDDNQYSATVIVSWNTGSVPNQVQLQEVLTNVGRF